jgi:hypothetical protein
MGWTTKFPAPIVLKGGGELVSLADARDLIFAMTERRQARDPWQQASESLMRAARARPAEIDAQRLADQIRAALKADGLI